MPFDVFISYSSQDNVAADAICSVLERNGIGCWIAPRNVLPSQTWAGAVVDALDNAGMMVLVFSGSANNSAHVEREVQAAFGKGLRVLPVRIEEVKPKKSLEFFIGVHHWFDAFTPPLEQHLQRLADVIKYILPPPLIGPQKPTDYGHGHGGYTPPPPQRPLPPRPPPPTTGVLFVTLIHPKTGQRVQMKTGFSGPLFIGSSFFGLPLFGLVFFSRKLNGLGTIYFFGSFIFYMILASHIENLGLFLMFVLFCASILLGVIGNKITARNFFKRGWTILDDGTGVAQAVKQRWGLPL